MTSNENDPLFGEAPNRIPLDSAPLVRVIAQVQFPPVLKINDQTHIASFQELIRDQYPFLEKEIGKTMRLQVSDENVSVTPTDETVWRLYCIDRNWRVTLMPKSISLEVLKYTDRADFLDRFQAILSALTASVKPGPATRIGYRYLNRISGREQLDALAKLVRPELTGIINEKMSANVERSMTEAVCKTKEGQLLARWGKVQANATYEPSMLAPISEASWTLDIDSFRLIPGERLRPLQNQFDPVELRDVTAGLANRAYAFFRWSVQDAFLERYGVVK